MICYLEIEASLQLYKGMGALLLAMRLDAPKTENPWLVLKPIGPPDLPFDDAYLARVRSAGSVDAMWRWLPRISGGGSSFEAYYAHIGKLTKQGKFSPMAAFRKSDDAFIGGASFLRASRTHRSVEIGFIWLMEGSQDWACFAALQHVMLKSAVVARAKRVVWNVATENVAMCRAMDRLGVKQEGVLRAAVRMNDGSWSDRAIYALVQDEISEMIDYLDTELEQFF